MSSAWSLPNVPPPSPAQLALALTIVKTRPRQLDIREYLLSLRSCIKSGRHTQPPAQRAYEEQPRECGAEHVELDADKRIDSITFWRQAYEKSEAAQAALLDRIYDLEARDAAARAQSAYVGGLPASATEKKPPLMVIKHQKAYKKLLT
ncbi:hypothetical protein KEM52_002394 [Ascosphaera acerosa]|nr:hypothetical protein KEM52_002394 [Ascosphaera acerosa]